MLGCCSSGPLPVFEINFNDELPKVTPITSLDPRILSYKLDSGLEIAIYEKTFVDASSFALDQSNAGWVGHHPPVKINRTGSSWSLRRE